MTRLRAVTSALAVAASAAVLATGSAVPASAHTPAMSARASAGPAKPTGNVCLDTDVVQALKAAKPGRLLAAPQDVTATAKLASGRLFRIVYATAGPQGDLQASCGLIATPGRGAAKGVVAWAHGTVGLTTACQPSANPASFVGPMPAGIGAPTKSLDQSSGALAGLLAAGYVVTATDYYSGLGDGGLQNYVLAVPSGLAVIDSARVFTSAATQFGMAAVAADARLPLVTWGHSQGGGSALWAGQLAKPYLRARSDQTLELAGVAGEAPATQFTTSPGQPSAWIGKHLGDRDMYNFKPGLKVPLPIGVALFSYVTASWSQVTDGTAGDFPVGPTKSINYADVLTKPGAKTAPTVSRKCLDLTAQEIAIAVDISKYLDPSAFQFFAQPFGGSKVDGEWTGAIDATCNDPGSYSKAIQDWCAWLSFNMPGPNGTSGYPATPRDSAGDEVPMYLAQGLDDRIIWCVDSAGKVQAANCLTAQFARSLDGPYCQNRAYLKVDYYAGVSHLGIPGAAANNSTGTGYSGSPLQKFISGAMSGSLDGTCITRKRPIRR